MTVLTERTAPPPDGINPARARRVVRALYAGPTLTAADLSAPLLALPDGASGEFSLPGATALAGIPATVARWSGLGIAGVKVFAYGHDRDSRATAALAPGNRMVTAISAAKATAPNTAVTTEVCGCSWTDHGECVLRPDDGGIDMDAIYPPHGSPEDARTGRWSS
ncbi:hypothetical protein ABZ763_12200 [Streptomyces bacillaris]|uniref:hypothetical protein n=1 Tax=Streptomyces bacillaris TaxID=68179 RepID=UPI00346160D4